MQHGLLCVCIVIQGVRGGVECSTGCSVPVVVQGVRGGLECSAGCSVPVVVQGVRGRDSSAARAALCL